MLRVELGLNQRSLRRWQIEVARRLRQDPDLALGIRWSKPVGDDLPSCIGALLALERVVQGAPARLTLPAEPTDLSPHVGTCGTDADLVIDLSGGTPHSGRRRWRLTFDGAAGDAPIVAALLQGRAPIIALSDAHDGAVIANARPGIAEDGSVAAGFEAVLARTISLIVTAVRGGGAKLRVRASPSTISCTDAAMLGSKALAQAALARISLLTSKQAHTRTGWRFVAGQDVIDLGAHPASGWHVLPDDGQRAYGQPFPIVRSSESWLFVSERNFGLDRSLISAVRFGPHGPESTPAAVFELPSDLSYPFVFEAEGNLWMIPEQPGGNSIDLYRATRFPGGWRHEACLVADVKASAPTALRVLGRWWLMAAVHEGGPAADMLHLWSAEQIRGPWRPHRANPVLIDAAGARSAGRIVERAGRLIRPIRDHDGRRGLALAEIMRLDDEAFEQRIVAEIAAGPAWPGQAVSTLNRAGSIECIDSADVAVAVARPSGRKAPTRQGADALRQGEVVGAT